MYALNETAVLRPCLGQRGGKPAYAAPGVAFRCRSEAAQTRAAKGDALERGAKLRIFARGLEARPGDRVELGGGSYLISEVRRMRGLSGVHHLEIIAKEAN